MGEISNILAEGSNMDVNEDGQYTGEEMTELISWIRDEYVVVADESCELGRQFFDSFESGKSEDDNLSDSDVDEIDVADIIDDLTWYEYEERSRKKDDLFSYYDYMTDAQKRECLALYLFYQEAPGAVEKKIKNALKNPSSYTLYSMDVSSVITYDEEKDEFTGFIDITYGGTNSFGGMEKETDSVWIDFAVDIETKDIYIRDITIWDL